MSTAPDIDVLTKIRDDAEVIYGQLSEMDIRSGAVGAAKSLVQKVQNAIDFLSENGSGWDDAEKLACNAWRVHVAATSEDGELPKAKLWITLDEIEKSRWRVAAARFREGS